VKARTPHLLVTTSPPHRRQKPRPQPSIRSGSSGWHESGQSIERLRQVTGFERAGGRAWYPRRTSSSRTQSHGPLPWGKFTAGLRVVSTDVRWYVSVCAAVVTQLVTQPAGVPPTPCVPRWIRCAHHQGRPRSSFVWLSPGDYRCTPEAPGLVTFSRSGRTLLSGSLRG